MVPFNLFAPATAIPNPSHIFRNNDTEIERNFIFLAFT